MKEKLPFIIIATFVTALSIAGFIVGAYLIAAILFGVFVLAPALIMLSLFLIVYFFDKSPIKTINSSLIFWFLMVLLVGAVGGSALIIGGISNGYVVLMLIFGGVFALVGIGGMIGLIVNFSVHIRKIRVFKKGATGIGRYVDSGGGYSTGGTRYGTSISHWYSIKFKYDNGSQIIEAKTSAVYEQREVEFFAEKTEFAIKYIGNRAVIIEQIQLKKISEIDSAK